MLAGAMLILDGMCLAGPGVPSNIKMTTVVESKQIPAEVRYEFDRGLGAGRTRKARDGKDGEERRVYLVMKAEGQAVQKKLLRTEREEPQDTVILIGPQGYRGSRGGVLMRSKVLEMASTAYTPSAGRGRRATGRTASGLPAEYGLVAVDPSVIPMGSLLYVEGYGFAKAADTGGAIKGRIIDVCLPNQSLAKQWGRRKVKVHVLKTR